MTPNEIVGMVFAWHGVLAIVGICVFLIIYQVKLDRKQKDYIRTLNEHDKAVILDYLRLRIIDKKDEKK